MKHVHLIVLLLFVAVTNGPLRAQFSTYEDLLTPTPSTNSAYDMSITVNPDNSATAHVLVGLFNPATQERNLITADSVGNIMWSKKQTTTANYTTNFTAAIRIPGGYFDCAYSFDNTNNTRKEVCIKSDANGNPVWAKAYQIPSMTFRSQTHCGQMSDGSFVVSGDVMSGVPLTYVHLMRLDSMGNVIWSQAYTPTTGTQDHFNMDITPAQCILVTAQRAANSNNPAGSSIMRVRADGSLHWAKRFYSGSWLYGVDIKSTPQDSIWVMNQFMNTNTDMNPVIIKTDSLGQVAWSKRYSYSTFDISPSGCITTRDNGLVIFGDIGIQNTTLHSYLMKVDVQGNLLWAIRTPGLLIKSIAETTSGGIAYVGTDINGTNKLIMGRKDPTGRNDCDTNQLPFVTSPLTVAWQPDSLSAAYFTVPVTLNFTAVNSSFTDSALCVSTIGMSETPATDPFIIAPNPAGEHIRISGLQGQGTIRLYNSRGQLCLQTAVQQPEMQLDVAGLGNGLYLLTVEKEGRVNSRKIIIRH